MVRELVLGSLNVGRYAMLLHCYEVAVFSIPRYTRYYKEVIKLELFIFLESLKVFESLKVL